MIRILIVDDHRGFRTQLRALLEPLPAPDDHRRVLAVLTYLRAN